MPDKPGASGVYRFSLEELNQGVVKLKPKGEPDPHLVVQLQMQANRRNDWAGPEGGIFDRQGNLYTGNFGDGQLFRIVLDEQGRAKSVCLLVGPPRLTCVDGLFYDQQTHRIYVADSERNAIHAVCPETGQLTTLWENDDTDGSEGLLDQPWEVLVRGRELILAHFDYPFAGLKNTRHHKAHTISLIRLP